MLRVTIENDVFLPAYRHLVGSKADIHFLWGGRDSGKTHFLGQYLLLECLKPQSFRCVMAKKTFESIKDSQWQTLKDIAEDWGIDHLFKWKTNPLEVVCILNGNKFIARGCDKPGKLRGIRNPTHAWIEEGNQLTEQDYVNLSTTLRSEDVQVQEWMSFNPESPEDDYEQFWLYRDWFAQHPNELNFSGKKEIRVGDQVLKVRYVSTHTTYKDNPFVGLNRIAKLETLQTTNPYYYRVFTLGQWGRKNIGQLWCHTFSEGKHIRPTAFLDKSPLHLTWDLNTVPYVTCLGVQISEVNKRIKVGVFREWCYEPPRNSIKAICIDIERQLLEGTALPVFYYGDASGNKRIEGFGNMTGYDEVRKYLYRYLHNTSNRTNRANPLHLVARDLINEILAGVHPIDIEIDPSCKNTIRDFQNLKQGLNDYFVEKVKDPQGFSYEKYGHCYDALVYLLVQLFGHLVKRKSARSAPTP